ncbi:MAG TPA: LytTR family DNA-binding domain-containing protein [Gemmatimonadaceae bacterium]
MRVPRNSLPDLHAVVDDSSAAQADSQLRLVEHESGLALPAESEELRPMIEQLLSELRSQRRRSGRLIVKTGGKVLFLRSQDVEWVEAAGNYVRLHVGGEAYLFRESMKNMESRLDGEQFVRIHRSAIVNLDRIRELQPWFHGEYVVILQDGTKLMASRVFSDRLGRLIA